MTAATLLYGPTASGKSALALAVQTPIVNADSLQIYDALPILTAQPSAVEQAQTPHHLYGFADPSVSMNAATWSTLAAQKIAELDRSILVGGTGMYMSTLLDGIAPIPDVPPGTREKVSAEYDAQGPDAFHARLTGIDPISAAKIHANRREQMIRAMEVFEGTGESISTWHAKPRLTFLPDNAAIKLIVFLPEKAWIVARSAQRFDQMLAQGVLEEVETFGRKYGTEAAAAKALGFYPLWAHVNGKLSLEDAKQAVLTDTSAYIKRQLTWGRNQLGNRESALVCATPDEVQIALTGN